MALSDVVLDVANELEKLGKELKGLNAGYSASAYGYARELRAAVKAVEPLGHEVTTDGID